MKLDRYTQLKSPVHRWDARWKCGTLMVFVFICAGVRETVALSLVLATSILLVSCTRIPLRAIIACLRPPLFVLLLMTPILAFTSGGTVIASLGFLEVYREGLILSGVVAVRAVSIMLVFVALFGSTQAATMMEAAAFFRIPSTLVAVLMFTYRYIFQYLEALEQLFIAARLRGFGLQRRFNRVRSTVGLITNLLVRSFEQSERVGHAMRMRGFQGALRGLVVFRSTRHDLIKALLFALLITCILWFEVK